jgi:uncharacterized repeat protein (TIGR03803 family)
MRFEKFRDISWSRRKPVSSATRQRLVVARTCCGIEPLEPRVLLSSSYVLSTLATFNSANGARPQAGLLADTAGNLYGTTISGGANGDGTVFEVATGTHALSTLSMFNNTNGANPAASLLADAAGNLYGTTAFGGASSDGTVFELAAGTLALSTLATFNSANGAEPIAGLIADAVGNLFGTTEYGGANGDGTLFEVAAGTHALSTLVNFNVASGVYSQAGLIADAAGNLYGTTSSGGASTYGTVFEVAAGTYALSTLATFNYDNGAFPDANLLADASGNLYGTTSDGGASVSGTVFEVAAGTHTLSTLATFNVANGDQSLAGLIADASGNLYGTTHYGGASDYGTVFEVAAGTHALSTLVNFNAANGAYPQAGLIADASGNLYGTTVAGGANNDGTVFELSPQAPDLAAPTGFAASQGTFPHHVTVLWNPVNGAASYQVFRSTTNDVSTATKIGAGITGLAFNDNSTLPGTLYYYWVRARNSSAIGPFSTSVSGYIPLAAPAGVSATTTLPHHVGISWNAVASAASYQIFRSASNDFSSATKIAAGITTTFFNDTSAVLGQNYFYWVRARNLVGVGLVSISVMGNLA